MYVSDSCLHTQTQICHLDRLSICPGSEIFRAVKAIVILSCMSGGERQKFAVCQETLCVGACVLECIGVLNLQCAEPIHIQRQKTACKMKCQLENPDHFVHCVEMLKTHQSEQDVMALCPSGVKIAFVRHQETRCLQFTASSRLHLHLLSLSLCLQCRADATAESEVCTHQCI